MYTAPGEARDWPSRDAALHAVMQELVDCDSIIAFSLPGTFEEGLKRLQQMVTAILQSADPADDQSQL